MIAWYCNDVRVERNDGLLDYILVDRIGGSPERARDELYLKHAPKNASTEHLNSLRAYEKPFAVNLERVP